LNTIHPEVWRARFHLLAWQWASSIDLREIRRGLKASLKVDTDLLKSFERMAEYFFPR
jgi:hypothetical protein